MNTPIAPNTAKNEDLSEAEINQLMQKEPVLRQPIDTLKNNVLPAAASVAMWPAAVLGAIKPSFNTVTVSN